MSAREPGRRANGEGSKIRAHAKGGFVSDITVDGKRRSIYGKTPKEVAAKVKEALRRAEDGAPLRDSRAKVAAWAQTWETKVLPMEDLAQSSVDTYTGFIHRWVVPAIGHMALGDVRKSHLDDVLLAMKAAGKSANSLRIAHTAMAKLFQAAVDEPLIKANPMEKVRRPAAGKSKAGALTRDQASALVAAMAGQPWLLDLTRFLLLTGLRRGEALGVRWEDVDEEEGVISVNVQTTRDSTGLGQRETKTEGSERTVDISEPLATLLRARRKAQAIARMKARPGMWTETGLVFTTAVGTAYEPNNVNRAFRGAVARAGLPTAGKGKVTPHTLRHSAATFLLEAGVSMKEVQAILGHASMRTTMDIYAHVQKDRRAAAMGKLGEALGW